VSIVALFVLFFSGFLLCEESFGKTSPPQEYSCQDDCNPVRYTDDNSLASQSQINENWIYALILVLIILIVVMFTRTTTGQDDNSPDKMPEEDVEKLTCEVRKVFDRAERDASNLGKVKTANFLHSLKEDVTNKIKEFFKP
jgi:hypothetical protein